MADVQGVEFEFSVGARSARETSGWGLVCFASDGALRPVSLHDGAVVGRGQGNGLDLGDDSLDPQHARFVVRADGVYISDLDTSTGTRIDGVPVSILGLAEGCVLRMGSTLALFVERDLAAYAGRPTVVGGELVVGTRQRSWVEAAIANVTHRKSMVIQGSPGVGKATLARVAMRVAGDGVPVQVVDGATIDPDHLLRTYDTPGPTLWLVTHVDRLPRAAQSDLVRVIRATEGSMMIGTVVGALEDAHAEGRVGTSLMGLVETRVLRVPDLEERREDIPALSLEMLRRMGIRLTEGVDGVFECVLRAGWPGGVRELGKQLAVAFDAGGTVEGAVGILRRTIERAGAKEPMPLQASDPDLARARLQKALALASGTVAVAARELRMSRQAFYRELRRLDLEWSK